MSVSLQKGQKVSLSKENAGLSQVIAGLGWDEVKRARKGLFAPKPQPIDCDASALLLRNGKLVDKADIIYFGNLRHKSGTVQHMGDNLTGAGDGDDEQIVIDLANLPAEYDRIVGEADGEAQKIVSKARTDMEQEREQALKEVKTEIGDLIALAVDKVAGTKASAESDKELIDQFLSDVDADDK